MERVQTVGAQPESTVASLASVDDGPPLAELVRLSTANGEGKRQAQQQLRQALKTLMPTEANAAQLLALIDAKGFHGVPAQATALRVLAIETLVRLGYPWALQVDPDEWAWYRKRMRRRAFVKWGAFASLLASGTWAVVHAFL
jgi:hypothetical protein